MSEKNKHNEVCEPSPGSWSEGKPNTDDRTGHEDLCKTNTVLSIIKDDEQAKEAIINIKDPSENEHIALYQTHAILSDSNDVKQDQDVIIEAGDSGNKDEATKDVKIVQSLDYSIYGHYGKQIRPPKTTLVYYLDLRSDVIYWTVFETECEAKQEVWLHIRHEFKYFYCVWVFLCIIISGRAVPDNQSPLDYDPTSRNGFVRVVFTILLIMLIMTATFLIIVLTSDRLSNYFRYDAKILAFLAMGVLIGMSYALACSQCTRIFPCNIILLFVAVICMSIIAAWITSRYETEILFYAFLSTCIIVGICIALAFSGFDFTSYMMYIVIIAAVFGAVTLVFFLATSITGRYMSTIHLAILLVGTLINAIVLVVELQMILGGGAIELGEDDYALGAYLLYTSIVDIFLKLVQILGIFDNM